MKKTVILVLYLTGLAAFAGAQVQGRFEAANRQYEAGEYAQALEGYAQLAREVENWKLEFNMGNCCVKLERFVDAKIHYLRALRLAPTREEVRSNLDFVNERLGGGEESRRVGFLRNLWDHFAAVVPLNVISVLLLAAVICLNTFLVMLLWKGRRKWLVYGLGFALLAALMLAGLQGLYQRQLDHRDTVVVTRAGARLRSGPGRGHTVLFTLRPGLDARILEQRENWLQVAAGQDVAGWIEKEAVEII